MVLSGASPLRRFYASSKRLKQNGHRRSLQQFPPQFRNLRAGSVQKKAVQSPESEHRKLILDKLRSYMEMMVTFLVNADALPRVADCPADYDVLRYVVIQLGNLRSDPEDFMTLVSYCCELLNQIEIELVDVEKDDNEAVDESDYCITIDGIGVVSQNESVTMTFASEIDLGETPVKELLNDIVRVPDEVSLTHTGQEHLTVHLRVTNITSERECMMLELQSKGVAVPKSAGTYRARLQVNWPGPSAKFADVRGRIAASIETNFSVIYRVLTDLRTLLSESDVIAATTLLENFEDNKDKMDVAKLKPMLPDLQRALTLLDSISKQAISEYKHMLSLKSLYVDTNNRNTLGRVQVIADKEEHILIQLQTLADLIHSCKPSLKWHSSKGKKYTTIINTKATIRTD